MSHCSHWNRIVCYDVRPRRQPFLLFVSDEKKQELNQQTNQPTFVFSCWDYSRVGVPKENQKTKVRFVWHPLPWDSAASFRANLRLFRCPKSRHQLSILGKQENGDGRSVEVEAFAKKKEIVNCLEGPSHQIGFGGGVGGA